MQAVKEGLVVGLFLAATESVAAVLTGRGLGLSYLVLLVSFDLALGAAASASAVVARRTLGWRSGDYADRFVPVAAIMIGAFLADKAVTAVIFGGRRMALVAAAFAGALGIFFFFARRVLQQLTRTASAELSCLLSLAILAPALVGARVLARSMGRAVRSPPMMVEALLLIGFVTVALVAQDRWLANHRLRGAFAWLILVPLVAVTGALALTKVRVFEVLVPSAGRSSPVRPAPPLRPNVLLISVDTLRADHVSVYGYERATTPNLARLAAESLVFTHALSPGTWTLPGHVAMLTGRFPGPLGAMVWTGSVPHDTPLLAELLRTAGYRTAAVVGNSLFLDHRLGWNRGFDFYSDEARRRVGYQPLVRAPLEWFPRPFARATAPWRDAEEVNRSVLAWLAAGGDGPFFLFVNFADTHAPYMPPDPWPDRYPGRLSILMNPVPAVMAGARELTDLESRHYRALYDGAVAYVDAQIGVLLGRLAALGLLDDTIVIVTSDHGEFLGEHHLFNHAVGPYEPVHRVPLLIRYPRGSRRGTEQGWVQLVDIVPTVLAAVGLRLSIPFDGEVLPHVNHPILIQQASMGGTVWRGRQAGRGYVGMYEGPWKMVTFDQGPSLLFNVETDPDERREVAFAGDPHASAMRERLDEASRRFPRRERPSLPSRELEEQLKAGGYIR
jgi:arylsulfatase A-like enzyme